MYKILICVFLLSTLIASFPGCSRKPEITPPGKIVGKPIIDLTGIVYPGSKPFDNAQYDYMSSDTPDKVAEWFRQNLPDATVDKPGADTLSDALWVVNYKDYIIEIIVGPNQTDTLVRYKKKLDNK